MASIYPTLGNKARIAAAETKPSALAVNPDGIPAEMKAARRWVCWCFERDDKGRWTKVPYNPETRRLASSTNSSTWTDFPNAWGAYATGGGRYAGIGFVLGDGWAGIDLDDSRDPATGALLPWAENAVSRFDSFADVSPTETGVKIFLHGKLSVDKGKKADPVEIYDHARYFTVTGAAANGCPCAVNERTELLAKFYAAVEKREKEVKEEARKEKANGKPAAATPPAPPAPQNTDATSSPDLADDDILDLAGKARNADKFNRLWRGDTGDYGGDDSKADLALCCVLAFYTKDAGQLDRLFRRSALMREKWDRDDYRQATIGKALSLVTETYKPKRRRSSKAGGQTAKAKVEVSEGILHLTDVGNGQRLVKHFGSDLRYCFPWKKWLAWTGRRWEEDAHGRIERDAKEAVRRIYTEAADADKPEDRAALAEHAQKSEDARRVNALIAMARSEDGIPVATAQLDADPFLFNVLNGTLDLRTAQLGPHNRADYLTKLAPVEFDTDADCPLWKKCLDRWMDGNTDLIDYLQRVAGYSLTGDVSEQCLWFLYGLGANGKSVFLLTLLNMLGDYGMQAVSDLLMTKRNESHPTERADLFGRRLVATIETEAGRAMAEALTKQFTGGDKIRARKLYQDFFEFAPTHKIFLAANHKPTVRGTDFAIWRRIKLVPFTVTIPEEEKDKHLTEKLKAEMPGVLAWAVAGCLKWQRDGMAEPDEVRIATAAYQAEQDTLAQFIVENCIVHREARCKSTALLEAYQTWSSDKVTTPFQFREKMKAKGYDAQRGHGGWYFWLGIGLNETQNEG